MLNHNHQNSECDFSADLISYLYGEINQKEKLRFEAHLSKCTACPVELAEFADVRFALGEWHNEFEKLPTPAIAVPYTDAAPVKVKISDDSDSWIARLRQAVSGFPAWSAATTAALAILVVCGGLFLFATKAFQPENIAQNAAPNESKVSVSPTIDLNTIEVAEKNLIEDDSQANKSSIKQTAKSAKSASIENAVIVKSEAAARTFVKSSSAPKNINASNKNNVFDAKVKTLNKTAPPDLSAPTLNGYEEIEDETLRLADLFAEVDTKD